MEKKAGFEGDSLDSRYVVSKERRNIRSSYDEALLQFVAQIASLGNIMRSTSKAAVTQQETASTA